MAKAILDRVWDWLLERYGRGGEADCCGNAVEEVRGGAEEYEPADCCE